jgi:hypothetical protein
MDSPIIIAVFVIGLFGPMVLGLIHYYQRGKDSKIWLIGTAIWAGLAVLIAFPTIHTARSTIAMQGEDWVKLCLGVAGSAFAASVPALIGFILLRRGRSPVYLFLGLSWLLLILAIALPGVVPARPLAQKNSCIANLKQIELAKHSWNLDGGQPTNAVPTVADLAAFLKGSVMPVCPAGGTYTLGAVNEPPHCSLAERGHALNHVPR